MKNARAILFLWVVCFSAALEAYETDTHAYITAAAWRQSVLGPNFSGANEVCVRLGLERRDSSTLFRPSLPIQFSSMDDQYLDAAEASTPFLRPALAYESQKMDAALRVLRTVDPRLEPFLTPLSLSGWLMRGAIREDDLAARYYDEGSDRPDVDPHGEITRVFNHFFDPINNNALFPCPAPIAGCAKSVDWALGLENALAPSFAPHLNRRNHFSWLDARRFMYAALTTKRSAGLTSSAYRVAGELESREREFAWATSFKAIGHALHFLEDAASPQHVRNDPHNHQCEGFASEFSTTIGRRTYEPYINYRLGGVPIQTYTPSCERELWVDFFATNRPNQIPLNQQTYAAPTFATPIRFFTTRHEQPNIDQRRGLADYANRNFFSEGTLPDSGSSYVRPEANALAPAYQRVTLNSNVGPNGQIVLSRIKLYREAVDAVRPAGYVDPGTVNGRTLLAAASMWEQSPQEAFNFQLSFDEYDAQADHLIPRAIGYSAGLINFFFRGKLEITPTIASIFAIADHSVAHAMDNSGYPRRVDNQKMFGFEKVRLRVRNITTDITESGTTVAIPQVMGGLLPGETQTPQLIAVARYHRNRCYRPNLSGERVQVWPVATGAITEPTCSEDVRTNYQEISVSAPLAINSEADLPRATAVEKMFDFSLDPIPINATDLFIQVVYVGRLGLEPASIALGTLDVSEPTFVAYWNNTDRFYNETASPRWIPWNSLFPVRGLTRGWICAGPFPRREVYRFDIATSGTGMGFGPNPGYMRVAMLFPQPGSTGAGLLFFTTGAAEGTGSGKNPIPRSNQTTGQLRQANREIVAPATLLAPVAGCGMSTSTTERWCWDPIQRRRGETFGAVINPLHLQTDSINEPTDVDAPPASPVFASTSIRAGGVLVYDQGAPFIACPTPNPGSLPADFLPWWAQQAEMDRLAEIQEAARWGIELPQP